MDRLIIITPDELKIIIADALKEHLICKEVSQEPVPDTLTMAGAIAFLEEQGYPTAKGQIYQLTSQGRMPFGKYGNKLVFSRKELLSWAKEQTHSTTDTIDPTAAIRASANNKIKKI